MFTALKQNTSIEGYNWCGFIVCTLPAQWLLAHSVHTKALFYGLVPEQVGVNLNYSHKKNKNANKSAKGRSIENERA
jgi:hypothetical protein